jgi:hypothetical protein
LIDGDIKALYDSGQPITKAKIQDIFQNNGVQLKNEEFDYVTYVLNKIKDKKEPFIVNILEVEFGNRD